MTCLYCVVCDRPTGGDKTCGNPECDSERTRRFEESAAFWKARDEEERPSNVVSLDEHRRKGASR